MVLVKKNACSIFCHLRMRLHYSWFFWNSIILSSIWYVFSLSCCELFSKWCLMFTSCLKVLPTRSCQLLHQQNLILSVWTSGLLMCITLITWRKMTCIEDGEATSRRFCSLLNFLVSLSGNYHLNFALFCQENKELQYMLPLGPYRLKYYIVTFLLMRSVNWFLCIFVLDRLACINLTCIIDMILFHSNISFFSLHGHILNFLFATPIKVGRLVFFCVYAAQSTWLLVFLFLYSLVMLYHTTISFTLCNFNDGLSPFSFVALDAGLPWSDAVHP
jgi:hypothetical protein